MATDPKHRLFSSMLEPLPAGEPFSLNYQPARIDRNALFALNAHFSPAAISAVRSKYHRAHLNFDDLKADLLEYDCPKPPRGVEPSYYAAIASVREDLQLYNAKVVPLTTGAVANHPDFPGAKSPGLPYKTLGYSTKRDAVSDPAVMDEIRKIWYAVEANQQVELPDVACYARAQICTRDTNKVRATWGYPLAVYMAEAAYFYPILDVLKDKSKPHIAYGVEMANGGMQYLHRMAEVCGPRPILLGDWKRFDKTIPAWLIRDAFKIVAEAIDWEHVQDSEGKIWKVREHRSKRRWRKLVQYFIDTPIRLSDGTRYMKHSGVPSGACFTNVIDSVVNMIIMRYLVYELTGDLPVDDIYLGDDSTIVLPRLIDLDQLAELALSHFGMVLNTKKSTITYRPSNIHFLGYYNQGGHPYKPLDTIVASTIYPERTCRNKVETITRLIGQAFSVFDAHHATLFFRCAKMLADEEKISPEELEQYIHEHPYRYKYLMTIGVDPTHVCFPDPSFDVPLLHTQPSNPRRVYTAAPNRNLEQLYALGLHWCGLE
ncbi:RdRp [Wuhan cricket virus 2]|uniref:RdRp n=1 Tax=Wuhan cricket virus 2 TaxID=1923697 RepID=UPI000909EF32|nr:RdRp [Wuhan cricket virus 2]APG78323.1 RdRp [Wuhan cricket virus 2]APG78358.1 RdRp [Wuhan cricket virus 2]